MRPNLSTISDIVSEVIDSTKSALPGSCSLREQVEPQFHKLSKCRGRLMKASAESETLATADKTKVREFMSRLPPLAFEIARETKELVQWVDSARPEQLQEQDEDYI